jgi:oligoendopeptidase F
VYVWCVCVCTYVCVRVSSSLSAIDQSSPPTQHTHTHTHSLTQLMALLTHENQEVRDAASLSVCDIMDASPELAEKR